MKQSANRIGFFDKLGWLFLTVFFVVSIFGPFKDRIVVIVGIAAGVVAAILFSVGPIRAFVIKRRVKGLTEAPDTSDKPMEG